MNVRISRLFVVLAVFASIAMVGCDCVTCPSGDKGAADAPRGGGCTYNVVALLRLFSSQGGNGGFSVFTQPGCTWTARSNNPDWLTITNGHSGTGNGEGNFRAAGSNDGRGRTGSITVSGQNNFTENIKIDQNPR
jgi:hypothetical protein